MKVRMRVNEREVSLDVEPRRLLADVLRNDLGLTGTHVGCEYGVCGACTVLLDGEAVRSCLLFAVQCHGRHVSTVESLSADGHLHPVQRAIASRRGLQCGFCTPGILMTTLSLLPSERVWTEEDVRHALSGNLCRCTGYDGIVAGVTDVLNEGSPILNSGGSNPPSSPPKELAP